MADINECETGTHDCDVNADCQNTDGSFLCVCKTGYEGNGTTCTGNLICFLKSFISGFNISRLNFSSTWTAALYILYDGLRIACKHGK